MSRSGPGPVRPAVVTARFLSFLDAQLVGERDGRPLWRLLTPLRYQSALLRTRLVVPAGFLTDFASVPRWPMVWLLAGDTAHAPAAVHDFLYQVHLPGVPRALADDVFDEALGLHQPDLGILRTPEWRRRLMAGLIRLFGESAWRSGPARFAVLNPALAPS